MGSPNIATALSTNANTAEAARDICQRAKAQVSAPIHLAFVFASHHHQTDFSSLAETIQDQLGAEVLLGCTGESIVCQNREIESQSALALWVAHLPDVAIVPMHLEFQMTGEGGAFVGWPDRLDESWPDDSTLLVLAEPFSFPTDRLLPRLNQSQPGTTVVGGMASGGWNPGQNRLWLGKQELASGAVAVLLHGAIKVRSVVSQGCRPIGRPLVVTKAQSNTIYELGGLSALAQVQHLFQSLSAEDQELARQGLHVGQVINEYQETFGRGDFLIRNLQGVDPESGAIAIGDLARVGQTIQFHVRDAQSADEELHALLAAAQEAAAERCLGGLMFTCNGRGTRLFSQPHHDARAIAQHWSDLPVAGFFAQGEIGPIGGQSFLHGFTASIALFEAFRESAS